MTAPSILSPRDEDQAGLDPVGGMNKHTNGMEFYGTSSNFALLSQLISKARSRLSSHSTGGLRSHTGTYNNERPAGRSNGTQDESLPATSGLLENEPYTGTRNVLKDRRISLVNLLFDEDSAMPDSEVQDVTQTNGTKTPVVRAQQHKPSNGNQPSRAVSLDPNLQGHRPGHSEANALSSPAEHGHGSTTSGISNVLSDTRWVELQIEKEYIRIFFDNLHYIHPFLSQTAFIAQCERDVWNHTIHQNLRKQKLHFFALYNTVVAVGALTAGTDLVEGFRSSLAKQHPRRHSKQETRIPTSVDLSKVYFASAKKSLGDYFEVCSLEGVQALILMVSMYL
jgi:hypothetical protein